MSSTTSKPNATELHLFAVLVGCTPKGRNIEQHDMFFGVGSTLEDLLDDIKLCWHKTALDELSRAVKKLLPGIDKGALQTELLKSFSLRDKVHIDAWTMVQHVDGYKIRIQPKSEAQSNNEQKLYFINLGGYRENEFEEYHKKLFVVATKISEALEKVKTHDFMKEFSPGKLGKGGVAHFDDKHEIDFEADDIVCLSEIISNNYTLIIEPAGAHAANTLNVGYVRLD